MAACVASLFGSCSSPVDTVILEVDAPLDLTSGDARVSVLPQIALVRRAPRRGGVGLVLRRDAGRVRIELPGACPLVIDTRTLVAASNRRLQPLFDVGPRERVVGLGQRFELAATVNCREAEAVATTFTIEGGAELRGVRVSERSFAATTLADLPSVSAPSGVVPVSARMAHGLRTALRFELELADGRRVGHPLGVAAVARSSGLPTVGLHHPVLLSGDEWALRDKPSGSTASLRAVGRLYELVPDARGRYQVQAANGRVLSLWSDSYDRVPLDCGHGDCHADIARSAASSPMTSALASDLGGCHTLSEPECATACHTTGELGVADGGFADLMARLGLTKLPAEHELLPPALQRLGGVGCLACHGPVGPFQPAAQGALLENHVCAVCHDAPPRYGHLQALASSRMSQAGGSPTTRREPCSRCHTTWGALGRSEPAHDGPSAGLACVTCHDVHPHGGAADAGVPALTQHGLLRRLPLPAEAASLPASLLGASRVCVSCHAPDGGVGVPEASAVAILAGQGGVEPQTGAPLELASPHVAGSRGCLVCHDSGPAGLLLGQSHGFRATEAACTRCHDEPMPRDSSIAARARSLLAGVAPALAAESPGGPWHARPAPSGLSESRRRALRNVLLVLEDPAADVHHPRYARALLDAAASSIAP